MTATDAGEVLLSAILGVEQRLKQNANKELSNIERVLGRIPQLNGVVRTYEPVTDGDEVFPREETLVQTNVTTELERATKIWTELWDAVLTREAGNGVATADITIGEVVVARNVPVTYLLFMEKQLADLMTVLQKLPVQDPAERWHYDDSTGLYRSDEVQSSKTAKVPTRFEKSPATEKHPAQVEILYLDKTIGHWNRTRFTSALPMPRVRQLIDRCKALQVAVRAARLLGNNTQVQQRKIGEELFRYLLAP